MKRYKPLTSARDTFIYEYVGDVVSHPSFMKRMRQYAEEGVKHFYFMMLQRDEVRYFTFWFLHRPLMVLCRVFSISMLRSEVVSGDSQIIVAIPTATLRNGQWESTSAWASSQTGTYVKMRNSPSITMWTVTGKLSSLMISQVNSYVQGMKHSRVTVERPTVLASWVARPRLILLGWMTFILMVRLLSNTLPLIVNAPTLLALGITDEVEKLGLKGNKKKKGRKLDEDYMVCLAIVPSLLLLTLLQPELKPLLEKDIPKLVQAIRQTQSKKVLFKLLTRIKVCLHVNLVGVSDILS